MALTPKLETRQSQSLLLTPQLRQAINLLQLNNLELNEVIEQELHANPLLEREEDRLADTPDSSIADLEQQSPEDEFAAPESNYQNEFDDFGSDSIGYDSAETADWADYNHAKTKRDDDDSFDYFEQKLAATKSLYNFLDEQIALHFQTGADKLLAKILSEQLDAAGYFRGDINTIAQRIQTSPERLKNILAKLKTFEPSGIFAESLAECLKTQLIDQNALTTELDILLDNLSLLAERKFKELSKLCNCSPEEISLLAAKIKRLTPKPTADWFGVDTSYVIPDVFVKRSSSGEYRVELNTMSLPRLLINRSYYSELRHDKKAARYLKENLSRASFLIRAMHQRATTILRVCEEIVLRQYGFFEQGINYLKPMSLKDLAVALDLSESTISRVTTNKYMSTPRGLFELKYFFSTAAGSYIGDDTTSTTAIKHKIKCLIEAEAPSCILSDDTIVGLLGQEGIKIARRTVAKYREALNIPTSAQRKRSKRV